MRVVLDTNVLVSGMLSASGPPCRIVDAVVAGKITLLFDAAILIEYREVLSRPKFPLTGAQRETVLQHIQRLGHVMPAKALVKRLPHRDDEKFLAVAVAGCADCLVTGNMRHYPAVACAGIQVLSPRDFIRRLDA